MGPTEDFLCGTAARFKRDHAVRSRVATTLPPGSGARKAPRACLTTHGPCPQRRHHIIGSPGRKEPCSGGARKPHTAPVKGLASRSQGHSGSPLGTRGLGELLETQTVRPCPGLGRAPVSLGPGLGGAGQCVPEALGDAGAAAWPPAPAPDHTWRNVTPHRPSAPPGPTASGRQAPEASLIPPAFLDQTSLTLPQGTRQSPPGSCWGCNCSGTGS